jgi:preprotein translocase subunit SecG
MITIHVIACVTLVVLVLLQSGKEGMGVIFGGGGGSLFGSTGAGGLLGKLTAGAATVFFLTSMIFTYVSTQDHATPKESIVIDMPVSQTPAATVETPAAPAENQAAPAQQPTAEEKKQ